VSNVLDYITFSSEGNATDFGDLSANRDTFGSCGNTTRGVFSGGWYQGLGTSGHTYSNILDYITIASTGNVTDFGDLTVGRQNMSSGVTSSSTRGLIFGGDASGSTSNVIDYITIASTGNAQDFGDLTGGYSFGFGASNSTRAVSSQDALSSGNKNIDVVTIASTGNATDFGDTITLGRGQSGACGGQGGLTA